ncbi:MAG TPA: dihydroorotase family protein [Trueperaceae bacterium]|nr:dihydroorotase family protein [Trueperaceae bacterium]
MQSETLYVGDVVLESGVLEGAGVRVRDGRIASIHRRDELPSGPEVADYGGCLLLPGGIDAHVHAYSSSTDQEGIGRLTRAAASGGVTTVIDMPYDRPDAITDAERLARKIALVEAEAVVDVALFGTIAKYGGWKQITALAEGGVCGFKLSTYETDPDRFPEIPDAELVRAFEELQKVGLVALFHAENGALIDPLIERLRPLGVDHPEAHCWSRPPESETTAVLKLLELARTHPVKLHIVHQTAPQAYDAVAWYRSQGVDVTAETCLQYLLLTERALVEKRGLAKCNPPLRDEATRVELWRRVMGGEVAFVTSDHAPWTKAFKDKPNIFDNASGLPGVDALLPVLYSAAVAERGLSPSRFAELVSGGPARRYGLMPRKGRIAVGADADITVLDPTQRWTVDAGRSLSVAKWSPYDGMPVQGRVVATVRRGALVFDGDSVVADAGSGSFVRPVGRDPS